MTYLQSPNYSSGRQGHIPDMVVFHMTSAEKGDNNPFLRYTEKSSGESVHYAVGKDGHIWQFVGITDTAAANPTSVVSSSERYYGMSKNGVVRCRPFNADLYTVSVAFEGYCGEKLTAVQENKGAFLLKLIQDKLMRIYRCRLIADRHRIVAHSDINPITDPNCPGEGFPFDGIIEKSRYIQTVSDRIL